MALWGNNDNLTSSGTVALDYDTGVVTGTGTTFGTVGFGVTGNVIRFGERGSGGTFFGDAVIVSIAGTQSCTIGSTAGLSGAAISGAEYILSELPVYTVVNRAWSRASESTAAESATELTYRPNTDSGLNWSPVGFSTVYVTIESIDPSNKFVTTSDVLMNDGNEIAISAIGSTTISLASTVSAGIATGAELTFKRYMDGRDPLVYALGADELDLVGEATAYEASDVGWVGVTTYMDCSGNLRVKKECLVAMSGITTGNIAYPTPED